MPRLSSVASGLMAERSIIPSVTKRSISCCSIAARSVTWAEFISRGSGRGEESNVWCILHDYSILEHHLVIFHTDRKSSQEKNRNIAEHVSMLHCFQAPMRKSAPRRHSALTA